MDKAALMEKLKALGWVEVESGEDCESEAGYCLVPPDTLWQNKPKAFYVTDADQLQELLNPLT